MSLKKEIETGEGFVKECDNTLNNIEELLKKGSTGEMVVFLLELTRQDYEQKIGAARQRLAQLNNDYVFEFEKESEECNINIDKELLMANKFICSAPVPSNFGKEVVAIKEIELLKPLVLKYNDDLPQAEKNELYKKIKTINTFINKVK